MEARMHDDPFGAQSWGNLDIGLEVMLDGVGDIGGYFSDIDCRGSVKAEVDGVPFARSAHVGGARVVEAAQHIGPAVELDVYPVHFMLCSPLDRVFELEPTPDIYPDPITQTH